MNENSINFDKIVFCILPFGTSNDLSTHFGFGKSSLYSKFNLNTIKIIIKDEVESITMPIDIWEMEISFDENNGGFITINYNYEKYRNITSVIRRGLIAYFSLGYDSRIGFNISKKKFQMQML